MQTATLSALFADLEAAIAAVPVELHPRDLALLEELGAIRVEDDRQTLHTDKVGSTAATGDPVDRQEYKGRERLRSEEGQCAFNTSHSPHLDTPHFTPDTYPDTQKPRRPGQGVIARARSTKRATKRRHHRQSVRVSSPSYLSTVPTSSTLPSRSPRKIRRMVSCVETFSHKSWRSLSPVEKFSAAVRQVASAGGSAFSLNLGIRREGMLIDHEDPRLRMRKNLDRQLRAAGFSELPIAWVFEATKEEHPRLHLHGAVDTSGLSDADLLRLDQALCKAASVASGAIGGQRQLDMRPIEDAAGWTDYILEDQRPTADFLRLDVPDLFTINRAMTRQTQAFYNLLREERRAA